MKVSCNLNHKLLLETLKQNFKKLFLRNRSPTSPFAPPPFCMFVISWNFINAYSVLWYQSSNVDILFTVCNEIKNLSSYSILQLLVDTVYFLFRNLGGSEGWGFGLEILKACLEITVNPKGPSSVSTLWLGFEALENLLPEWWPRPFSRQNKF